MPDHKSPELDKYEANQRAINQGLKDAGMGSVLDYHDMTFGEFQKHCAARNVDLSAACVRPILESSENG